MYDKIITPVYEVTGRRKKLTGFIGELYDGQILLHSQEYSTNSQAERALDQIVFDLLTDLHEHGLVDDVPAALESEHVTSTHLPSWQDATTTSIITTIVHQAMQATPTCKNCNDPHHTWQCPEIGDLLLAEPVVMVPDVEYAPFGFAA